jgi:hypothetical protein
MTPGGFPFSAWRTPRTIDNVGCEWYSERSIFGYKGLRILKSEPYMGQDWYFVCYCGKCTPLDAEDR